MVITSSLFIQTCEKIYYTKKIYSFPGFLNSLGHLTVNWANYDEVTTHLYWVIFVVVFDVVDIVVVVLNFVAIHIVFSYGQ